MNKNTKMLIERICKENNRPLFELIFKRRKDEPNRIALIYRGEKITYNKLKENVYKYARVLNKYGIKQGDEIPMCIANCPEFVYILGAISLLGAKANIFGNEFDQNYISEILNSCDSDIVFVSDNFYDDIKQPLNRSNKKNKIIIPLNNSLKNHFNPYNELDKKWESFKHDINYEDNKLTNLNNFLETYDNNDKLPEVDIDINDDFTITYSSGSTNSTEPKAIVHDIKSYVIMGIFHDPEISKVPSMHNLRLLAHIPTHSNTNIMSCITDCLIQGSEVALEPIYDKDHFVDSLLINKPSFVCATRSFWINAAKTVFNNPKYKNVKMPFLFAPMDVGEQLAPGEEKYCNKFLRKVSAGKDKTRLSISPITMSIAGGDCEHGGLFFLLFRSWQNKKLEYLINKRQKGLRTYKMADVQFLDNEGKYCKYNQIGRMVAKSPCTMTKYKNNEEETNKFFIKDAYGITWGDCNVYGYKDEFSGIHIKGRIKAEEETPSFLIADEVLKDTKNIMSCEVIQKDGNYIIHFEPFPGKKININNLVKSIDSRCKLAFDENITSRFIYRYRNNLESFPLTGCGKRNNIKLSSEEIDNNYMEVLGNKKNQQVIIYNPNKIDTKCKQKVKKL